MKQTRDLTLIIMFAVLLLIENILVSRVSESVTGIAGFGYLFTIIYSITLSVAYLMYRGKRWRIITQVSLYSLLQIFLLPFASLHYSIPPLLATVINASTIDIVANSFYEFFNRRDRLVIWVILTQLYYWGTHSIWTLVFTSLLFAPFESALKYWFIPVALGMIPVMVVEAIAGGYIGNKIYKRVEQFAYFSN